MIAFRPSFLFLEIISVSWMLKKFRVKVSLTYINRAKPSLSNETAQLATALCYISI